MGFTISTEGPYGRDPYDTSHRGWGSLLDTTRYRFIYAPEDDSLGVNMAYRAYNDFQDLKPGDSDIFNPPTPHDRKYLMTEPSTLDWYLFNSPYIRFECERHPQRNNTLEYPGFLELGNLRGRNARDDSATSPAFLKGSADAVDTSYNCVQVKFGIDSAGAIDSAFWNPLFLDWTPVCYLWHQGSDGWNHKLNLRLRVRIDSTSFRDSMISLFIAAVTQNTTYDAAHHRVVMMNDTVRLTSQFSHWRSGIFDTIMLPFWSKLNVDSTLLKITWLGHVSMTFDYAEVFTRIIDSASDITPITRYDSIGQAGWIYSPHPQTQDWLSGDSYEGLTKNHDARLKRVISSYVNADTSNVNLIFSPEERPIGDFPILKRMMRLMRDSSGGKIEFVPMMHDSIEQNVPVSGDGIFYDSLLVNQPTYLLEGVRKGWLDSTLYADPAFFMIEPYTLGGYTPLPRRIVQSDSASVAQWENLHNMNWVNQGSGAIGPHYTRENYLALSQASEVGFLWHERSAKRVCSRNEAAGHAQRFITSLQVGESPGRATDTLLHRQYQMVGGMTGAQIKATANLAVSAGCSGLHYYLYLSNGHSPAGPDLPVYNGGLMSAQGDHSTDFQIDSLRNPDGSYRTCSAWTGWHENYAAVKAFIPAIQTYGDTLLHSKYVGDIRATEIYSDSKFPFVAMSIRSYDDANHQDVLTNVDSTNQTLVHVSVWRTDSGRGDTLLYITNMRTDDSFDSVGNLSTIDRRFITLKMKAPHMVTDVFSDGQSNDNGKIWGNYVNTQLPLSVWLPAGDGILVRLGAERR